ncbi:alpha/beta hydrolase [Tumidithrix elongata RA019]|uniref:Alpha/beta hydrolase n=1 Tax=Tumidithrix elongata BACA0141 TaxID=2716417 RepID=A0AAW9PZ17_9CYAN|nr:alpha/beta hydrolase [Tumidithrix elongata RA019]
MRRLKRRTWRNSCLSLLLGMAVPFGTFTAALLGQHYTAAPAICANKISFWFSPFGEFTIPIADLAKFAKDGTVSDYLSFYLDPLSPEQKAQFREFLNQRYPISHVTVSQFTYSPIGQILVKRLGAFLKTDDNQNGFYALRAAFILSAADPDGLTPINVMKKFPVTTIKLDLPLGLEAYSQLALLLGKKDAAIAAIQLEAEKEALTNSSIPTAIPDLRQVGQLKWQVRNFSVPQPERGVKIPAQIYLPIYPSQDKTSLAPVIVISHGLASNPDTFAYLSQHLASHGFAVAVLEHPTTGSKDFKAYLSGFHSAPNPKEFVYRPLDIKFLLDELERQTKSDPTLRIDPQQVGVIGQSLGGYTVLLLSGAEFNFEQIQSTCAQPEPNVRSFNASQILQCRVADLPPANYNLRDRRIKAVLAVNPLANTLFGKQGMRQVQIPIMIVASGDDLLTPAIPEQMFPFTWLTAPIKYLAVVKGGTHFSFLASGEGGVLTVPQTLIGADPNLSQPYLKALSLAFFKTYLANQMEFRPYLSATYVKTISNPTVPISLVTAFSEENLLQAIEKSP